MIRTAETKHIILYTRNLNEGTNNERLLWRL